MTDLTRDKSCWFLWVFVVKGGFICFREAALHMVALAFNSSFQQQRMLISRANPAQSESILSRTWVVQTWIVILRFISLSLRWWRHETFIFLIFGRGEESNANENFFCVGYIKNGMHERHANLKLRDTTSHRPRAHDGDLKMW